MPQKPELVAVPPQLGDGPPQLGDGLPQFGGGPPQLGDGPPQLGDDPPQHGDGPPQRGDGPPQLEAVPPQLLQHAGYIQQLVNLGLIQHLQQLLNSGQFVRQQQQPFVQHVVAGNPGTIDIEDHGEEVPESENLTDF